MKKIKTYEDFVNEEINLKKALTGAALAGSLLGGMSSCKKSDIKPQDNSPIETTTSTPTSTTTTNSTNDLTITISGISEPVKVKVINVFDVDNKTDFNIQLDNQLYPFIRVAGCDPNNIPGDYSPFTLPSPNPSTYRVMLGLNKTLSSGKIEIKKISDIYLYNGKEVDIDSIHVVNVQKYSKYRLSSIGSKFGDFTGPASGEVSPQNPWIYTNEVSVSNFSFEVTDFSSPEVVWIP